MGENTCAQAAPIAGCCCQGRAASWGLAVTGCSIQKSDSAGHLQLPVLQACTTHQKEHTMHNTNAVFCVTAAGALQHRLPGGCQCLTSQARTCYHSNNANKRAAPESEIRPAPSQQAHGCPAGIARLLLGIHKHCQATCQFAGVPVTQSKDDIHVMICHDTARHTCRCSLLQPSLLCTKQTSAAPACRGTIVPHRGSCWPDWLRQL